MQRKLISAAILSVLLISAAYAQTDAPAASAGAPAVSTKKALRARNRQTEQAVRKALSHTKGLDSTAIVIVARSGKVTLDGTVPDASQIQLAQDAAQTVSQAKSVANNLTVKVGYPRSAIPEGG
ncbi:BON domain-containing protein [Paraburkholderia sp. RL18-103-BIB-C]|jgi:hyperosmotically inducible protein|uniref:BON domain-containing protein n=1 Tax=unclassified Paraburkholderia TaxID=2615204 RepID=UPI0038B9D6DC